jgi:hypothetical protein
VATDYQERMRLLSDIPWSGQHGCYVVFHVKVIVVSYASTFVIELDAM